MKIENAGRSLMNYWKIPTNNFHYLKNVLTFFFILLFDKLLFIAVWYLPFSDFHSENSHISYSEWEFFYWMKRWTLIINPNITHIKSQLWNSNHKLNIIFSWKFTFETLRTVRGIFIKEILLLINWNVV